MRESSGGNENPPPVNKEDSSCRFFHVMIGASAGAPFLFFPSLFLFFPRGGKGGRRGTQR